MLNYLTQTILKVTVPGVPDFYQGNELWDLSLVDPDNRRPVDYARRQQMLAQLKEMAQQRGPLAPHLRALLDTPEDGRAKLYVMWRLLALRCQNPDLFYFGD